MRVEVLGHSASQAHTAHGKLNDTASTIVVSLDTQQTHCVPSSEWDIFCMEMLGTAATPTTVQASRWAMPAWILGGYNFLKPGESLQVHSSLALLASCISDTALSGGLPPPSSRHFQDLFFGRHIADHRGNFLYVPNQASQATLATNPSVARIMFDVGYLFRCDLFDGLSNILTFYFRPFNTAFVTSSRWAVSSPERTLHDTIEALRSQHITPQ
jgi:hypothetical protein